MECALPARRGPRPEVAPAVCVGGVLAKKSVLLKYQVAHPPIQRPMRVIHIDRHPLLVRRVRSPLRADLRPEAAIAHPADQGFGLRVHLQLHPVGLGLLQQRVNRVEKPIRIGLPLRRPVLAIFMRPDVLI